MQYKCSYHELTACILGQCQLWVTFCFHVDLGRIMHPNPAILSRSMNVSSKRWSLPSSKEPDSSWPDPHPVPHAPPGGTETHRARRTVHFQPHPGPRRFFSFKDLSLPPVSTCDICNHNLSLILLPMSALALDSSVTLNEGWHIWLKPPGRGRQGRLKQHLTAQSSCK